MVERTLRFTYRSEEGSGEAKIVIKVFRFCFREWRIRKFVKTVKEVVKETLEEGGFRNVVVEAV